MRIVDFKHIATILALALVGCHGGVTSGNLASDSGPSTPSSTQSEKVNNEKDVIDKKVHELDQQLGLTLPNGQEYGVLHEGEVFGINYFRDDSGLIKATYIPTEKAVTRYVSEFVAEAGARIEIAEYSKDLRVKIIDAFTSRIDNIRFIHQIAYDRAFQQMEAFEVNLRVGSVTSPYYKMIYDDYMVNWLTFCSLWTPTSSPCGDSDKMKSYLTEYTILKLKIGPLVDKVKELSKRQYELAL